MKAARVWTPRILTPPLRRRDPSDLHAHTACSPPSPPTPPSPPGPLPPPHLLPSPTIKTWAYRRESVERTGEKRSPQNAIFAQPSSPRLHCYSAAKGDRLIVITRDPSVISATLETGVSVAAAAFRAPVVPVLKQKVRRYIFAPTFS